MPKTMKGSVPRSWPIPSTSCGVAATLLHPFAPEGTEMVREYLGVDERLWDWAYIFEPLSAFMGDGHAFRFLEPRVDFFRKHPSQLGS